MTHLEFNLLIIDDDHNFAKALGYSLKQSFNKMALTTAFDGITGLEHIERNGFHMVLLDLVMPGMNGAQVLQEIRQMNKNYIIIVLTAHAAGDIITHAKNLNPDAIFDKCEFKTEDLLPFLNKLKN